MTAQIATLTDFLLARIAEDEEAVRGFRLAYRLRTDARHQPLEVALPLPDYVSYDRVLAECEAKRAIVEEATATMGASDGTTILRAAAIHGERWLRHLTIPYADHPDFREEWRV